MFPHPAARARCRARRHRLVAVALVCRLLVRRLVDQGQRRLGAGLVGHGRRRRRLLTIENPGSAADALVGAIQPGAKTVDPTRPCRWHPAPAPPRQRHERGCNPWPSEIAAGAPSELKPGSYHLMSSTQRGPRGRLPDEITLTFEKRGR